MRAVLAGLYFTAIGYACHLPDLALTYPPLARQARIQGHVTILLSWNQGAKLTIEGIEGHPLLYQSVAEVVAQSPFPLDCAGQTKEVTVDFSFMDCYSEGVYLQIDRTSAASWRVLSGKPYAIASGEQRVRRRFPLFFLYRSVGFCVRSPSDGTQCPDERKVN